MRRRDFILGSGATVALPFAARAEQAERVKRIGVLWNFRADDPEAQARLAAFAQALSKLVPDFAEARVSQFLEFRSQMGHLPSISGGTRSSDSGY